MKVSTRLAILVGSMAVLVYGIGELGLFGITDSNERLQSVYEDRAVPAAELGEIRALLLELRLALNAFVVTPTPEIAAQRVALIDAALASIDKKWQVYAAKARDAQEAARVQAFAAENAKLLKDGFEPALAALRAVDPAQVQRVLVQKIRPQFVPTEGALKQRVGFHLDAAKRQFEEATARDRMIQKIAISAVVSGLLFSVLFGVALCRPGPASPFQDGSRHAAKRRAGRGVRGRCRIPHAAGDGAGGGRGRVFSTTCTGTRAVPGAGAGAGGMTLAPCGHLVAAFDAIAGGRGSPP